MNKKYIVYRTTNLVNSKFYIGVHKETSKTYFGSGKLISFAIKKYGRENFKRETLKEFSNEQDAYAYEKELVNEEMINNPLCYNLVEGGGNPPKLYGKDHHKHWKGKKFSENHLINLTNANVKHWKGKKFSNEHKLNISNNRPLAKKCSINNMIFNSCKEAGRYLNVSGVTIRNWCNNINYASCFFI